MPNKRIPWFKCWGGITSDPKVAPLSDAVFRTWVELLDAASQQPVRGRFKDRKSAASIVRRPVANISMLVSQGLIDEAHDGLTMHNWDQWQRWRQEDAYDNGSPPDEPPDQHTINTRSTQEQLTNGHSIDTSPLRAKKGEERSKTLDVRREDVETKDEDPPTPHRGKRPRAARTVLSDQDCTELIDKYAEQFGSADAASAEIDAAMNHNARFKCQSERLYVDTWLRRELLLRPRTKHAQPHAGSERVFEEPVNETPSPRCACGATLGLNATQCRRCERSARSGAA